MASVIETELPFSFEYCQYVVPKHQDLHPCSSDSPQQPDRNLTARARITPATRPNSSQMACVDPDPNVVHLRPHRTDYTSERGKSESEWRKLAVSEMDYLAVTGRSGSLRSVTRAYADILYTAVQIDGYGSIDDAVS